MPPGTGRGPHFVTLSPIRSQPPSNKALITRPPPYPQPQSLFLTRLPAELRKKIYTYVFTPTHSTTAHPLSLISTCRKIHTEASLLASTTHTFPLNAAHKSPSDTSHPTLDQITARLSSLPQRTSIRHIAIHHGEATAALLSAALSILPSLSTIALRIPADKNPLCPRAEPSPQDINIYPSPAQADDEEGYLHKKAVAQYAPRVFLRVLHEATQPRGMHTALLPPAAHQQLRWGIEWPQLESEGCYVRIVSGGEGDGEGVREELFMDADAISEVNGVQTCFCGEGDAHVIWTSAILHRQSEKRSVAVTFLPWTEEKKPETVVLRHDDPGKRPSVPSLCGAGAGGLGYAGSELYWEGLRRRNGDLGAVWRGWWRGATTVRGGRSYGVAKSCRIS